MTHRQFRTWVVWQSEQMDEPSKSDAYVMQLTLEVRRVIAMFTKRPGPMTMQAMRIKYVSGNRDPISEVEQEVKTENSINQWCGILGIDKDGNPLPGVKPKVIPTKKQKVGRKVGPMMRDNFLPDWYKNRPQTSNQA